MLRVMVESPFAGEVERNKLYLRRALAHSISLGEAPFASHFIYPEFLDDTVHTERERGLAMGRAWLDSAHLVAFYMDYGMSPGMDRARSFVRNLGKQIEFREIGLNASN